MSIISGDIQGDKLYRVTTGSDGSLTYNGVTLFVSFPDSGHFGGIWGITTFTTTGDITVDEILELKGGGIEYVENGADARDSYNDVTEIRGFAIEFELTNAEKIVHETTKIQGFAIELIDYPFYSFSITETRL